MLARKKSYNINIDTLKFNFFKGDSKSIKHIENINKITIYLKLIKKLFYGVNVFLNQVRL